MTNIANTIYQAIVTHTAWKKRLHEMIEIGKNGCELNSEQCDFGKWLIENAEQLSLYEHYSTVIKLHNQCHIKAEEIITLASQGKSLEARAQIDYGSEFEHMSQELVQTLIAWHDVVIGKK